MVEGLGAGVSEEEGCALENTVSKGVVFEGGGERKRCLQVDYYVRVYVSLYSVVAVADYFLPHLAFADFRD